MQGVDDSRLTCCTLLSLLFLDEAGIAGQQLLWYLQLFHMSKTQLCSRMMLMDRQQLLAGWGLREVLLMHKDVNNNELQNVSQGPV